MKSGSAGAIVLLLLGGGLYYASTNLTDYFAQRSEAGAPVMEEAVAAIDEAVASIAPVADGDDLTAEPEIAEADGPAEEATPDDVAPDTETAMLQPDEEAVVEPEATSQEAEVLESLGHDMREEPTADNSLPELDVVRVDPTGEVVIAGNAPEGDRVGLLYNGEMVAETDVDAGGDFVLVPDEALPSGEGTLEVVVIDENGDMSEPADEQVAVVLPEAGSQAGFLVGVLRPGEPVEIIEREAPETEALETEAPETDVAAAEPAVTPAETPATASATTEVASTQTDADPMVDTASSPFVVVDAIELEGQEIWIAGGALPGTVVRLYQDNELLGETTTGPEGRFLYEGALLEAEGQVRIRADALAAGTANVVARAQVPFQMPVTQLADASPAPSAETAATDDDAAAVEVAGVQPEAQSTERISVLDTGNVIIRRGDNLWRLSRRVYGQGVRYTSIYDANRDQIGDPALIFPGQVFGLPAPEAEWGEVPGFEALEADQIPPAELVTN